MATKRKKKNVKMKTGENRPKDKRPCISSKGREKEGHDGVANAKMAKNVDASLTFVRRIQSSRKLLVGEKRNQIQQKMINLNENDNKTTPLLRSKANLPTLVVRPITVIIDSAIKMRKTLEANISPKEMEIKIMGLKPAMGNGVVVQVETPEMVIKLKDAINSHTNLQNVCKATTPKIRMPQIIIYDVEKCEIPREEEEFDFLNQIKLSNDIVENMRVLYRKKGRGSSSHWVISLDPKAFRIIKDKARLRQNVKEKNPEL
ncbi:hypothetical protein HNY73_010015 [Argiope bruennichi]|uniref:Uncharacterized protein n=1 Tax=Argiope bruennichi TaxID=94029 RepID=A0A8T0F0G9_ARGBR|nr:hypothetical protein HNY73_010015 [Argiope bruennichi]